MNANPTLAAALLFAATLVTGCSRPARESGEQRTRTKTSASVDDGRGGTVTDYSLYDLPSSWRDQHGDTVLLRALAGRVRVVAMIYTSCTATCPLIIAALKRVEASVPPAQRARLGFVLVSLDPGRDTPGRLAEWARETGLDPTRWTLITGDASAVRELATVLDVRYQKQPGGELAHTNGLAVLDSAGRIAHRQLGLGGTDETIDAVRNLLRRTIHERTTAAGDRLHTSTFAPSTPWTTPR